LGAHSGRPGGPLPKSCPGYMWPFTSSVLWQAGSGLVAVISSATQLIFTGELLKPICISFCGLEGGVLSRKERETIYIFLVMYDLLLIPGYQIPP
jgi:hypothetical protein